MWVQIMTNISEVKTKKLEDRPMAIRSISMMARNHLHPSKDSQRSPLFPKICQTFEHSRIFPKIAKNLRNFQRNPDVCRRLHGCFRKF